MIAIGKKEILAHKFLLFSLLILFFLTLLIKRFVILPMANRLDEINKKIVSLSVEKDNLLKEIKNLKEVELKLREKEGRLAEYFILKSKLADFNASSKILRDLLSFHSVKYNRLNPDKKEQIGKFKKWILHLNLTGSYADLNNYFNYLDRLPYILSVKNVKLSKGNAKGEVFAEVTVEVIGK